MNVVVDSITQLPKDCAGKVVLAASHGGLFTAWLALEARLRAVVFHDAGVGFEGAGVAGIDWLASHGMPSAGISFQSARIGDGDDCLKRGIISKVNQVAETLGIKVGQTAAEALSLLENATVHQFEDIGKATENRIVLPDYGGRVICMDSASLIYPEDIGKIVITGSHGAAFIKRPDLVVKQPVAAAYYSDAGGGIEGAGFTRLPILDEKGIIGITVSAKSARIGDGLSIYNDGVISAVNKRASEAGVSVGMRVKDSVAVLTKSVKT